MSIENMLKKMIAFMWLCFCIQRKGINFISNLIECF